MPSTSSRARSRSNSTDVDGNTHQPSSPRSSAGSESSDSGKFSSENRTSLLPQLFSRAELDINVAMNYVLQRFFDMNDVSLAPSLRAVDLIVDQTYSEALTLRQLNDTFSNKQYRYFNTTSRNKKISNCPIFCVAVYAANYWGGHAGGSSIHFDGFQSVPLLRDTKSFEALAARQAADISPPADDETPIDSLSSPSSLDWSKSKVIRSMEPPNELNYAVFPWLSKLQEDLETLDRTNYNLHSLCELFEYLARVLIQDLAYLSCTNELPSLLSNVLEYVPRLYTSMEFKQFKSEMQRLINAQHKNMDWNDQILSKIEGGYIDICRRFALHNQSLHDELRTLRLELASIKKSMSDVLQTQRLYLSGGIPNGPMANANNVQNGPSTDKNGLPANITNSLGTTEEHGQISPSLTSRSMFHSLSGSAVPESQVRKLPLPTQAGLTPPPADSPFKRFKFDDLRPSHGAQPQQQQGPQQYTMLQQSQPQQSTPGNINATLDSMLSRGGLSPRLGVPSSTGVPMSSQLSPQFGFPSVPVQMIPKTIPSGTSSYGDSAQEVFKYKLSRENKTIWDLFNEWFVGLNGEPSIKSLIDTYGWRRWKVGEDSHFFPTRRIIIDYIEREVDRGLRTDRFVNMDRESMRKVVTDDLEKFRATNGLTLNSISMYFRNLTRKNTEICIYENFQDWSVLLIDEDEKNKYCKRQHNSSS
ncbi:LADA_0D04610g1_1 [Lachancea dasiensis]|uniref:LADA_0D04610g1_1 n=1 Tax=Lachancea dasiensis TaxID=1072105 RepID=A0A1G4J576_9SACH|nr:LADA_0D04610g1_1 [Lachancea dasiensis]